MEFCKAFNARTAQETKGTPLPVVITYYQDKSFTFEIKSPPASYFLKQAAKIQSGSKLPGRDSAGTVTMAQCREIAQKKLKDLNTNDVEAGAKIIAGSARAMGLQVTGA
jgi:large subunit ribosomal protein L11